MASADNKALMTGVIKYHFWAVFVIALLAGGACWFLATGSLQDEYDKRVQKISGDLQKARAISGEANHPNIGVFEEVSKASTAAAKSVRVAWAQLYKNQKDANPWPSALGEDFLSKIKELKPTDEIPDEYRGTYSQFIREHLPKLRELIRAKRITLSAEAKAAASGDATAPAAPAAPTAENTEAGAASAAKPADNNWLIDWTEGDFARIDRRFSAWTSTPSSMEVRLAQEDLWVYEALLRVIRDTNRDATSRDDAAVKRIDALEIGKEAVAAWEKLIPNAGKGEADQGGADQGAAAAEGDAGTMTKEMRELLDRRYVNEKGKPLSATTHGLPQYKMMPIHLRMSMAQARISHLLVQCANSTMPIEVRYVKLSTAGLAEAARAADNSSAASATSMVTDTTGRAADPTVNSTDIGVEILGIISIYNPPPEEQASADGQPAAPDAAGGPSGVAK